MKVQSEKQMVQSLMVFLKREIRDCDNSLYEYEQQRDEQEGLIRFGTWTGSDEVKADIEDYIYDIECSINNLKFRKKWLYTQLTELGVSSIKNK
jgi:hypothetical protein